MSDQFLVSDRTRAKLEELIRKGTGRGTLGTNVVADGAVQLLEVQSGSANTHGRPAFVQIVDDTGTISDLDSSVTVRVDDPNGGDFTAGQFVLARYVGVSAGTGEACFVADQPIVTAPDVAFTGTGGPTSLPHGVATDAYEFDLDAAGLYLIHGVLSTAFVKSATSDTGNIYHVPHVTAGTGTAGYPTNVVNFAPGNISDGSYSIGEWRPVAFTYWVTVTTAPVTIVGRLTATLSGGITALHSDGHCSVWKHRLTASSAVASLSATVGSTAIQGGTADGILYKTAGNTLGATNGGDLGVSSGATAFLAAGHAKIRAAAALRAY